MTPNLPFNLISGVLLVRFRPSFYFFFENGFNISPELFRLLTFLLRQGLSVDLELTDSARFIQQALGFLLRQGLSVDLELTDSARFIQQALGILMFLTPKSAGVTGTCHHAFQASARGPNSLFLMLM